MVGVDAAGSAKVKVVGTGWTRTVSRVVGEQRLRLKGFGKLRIRRSPFAVGRDNNRMGSTEGCRGHAERADSEPVKEAGGIAGSCRWSSTAAGPSNDDGDCNHHPLRLANHSRALQRLQALHTPWTMEQGSKGLLNSSVQRNPSAGWTESSKSRRAWG